ncbi:MAG: phosphoribosylamine--glycine ligase [Pleomorphochaeta sp.]
MNVLIVGGGGREDAIIQKLLENKTIDKIFALPGVGVKRDRVENINIGVTDFEKIIKFCKTNIIDFAIVSPDDPLVLGLVDELEKLNILTFGPNKKAAIIEGSKSFAKSLMKKYDIPTAKYEAFDNSKQAIEYLDECSFPLVIKADGLALGKGVVIAENYADAKETIIDFIDNKKFSDSSSKIIIEEFLDGYEVSILAFCDGNTIKPLASSMDHKRIYDNDMGPNTGGMGVIAPNPFYTNEVKTYCEDHIFYKTIEAMKAEGRTFRGCLYFGLMIKDNEAKVIEYNCRFGDPETQAVLPLLESDLLSIMMACCTNKLLETQVVIKNMASCNLVVASGGYPIKYEKNKKILIKNLNYSTPYFAGVKTENEELFTNGGRVLSITSVANSLDVAVKQVYQDVENISFENMYYRKDIGQKAL